MLWKMVSCKSKIYELVWSVSVAWYMIIQCVYVHAVQYSVLLGM